MFKLKYILNKLKCKEVQTIKKKKTIILIILIITLLIIILFQFKNKNLKSNFQDYLLFFKLYGDNKSSNIQVDKLINKETIKSIDTDENIARYYFDVTYKNTDFKDINLTETIDSKTLINEKIAPGTKGEFEIILTTNQNLKYKIEFKSQNEKPYNLKFKLKDTEQEYRTLEELQKEMQGEIHVNETKKINVSWEWKYESDEKNLKSQDMQDALDGNKIQKYNFTINVLGEEI